MVLLRCIKKIVDTVEHLFVFVIRGNIFDIDVVGGGGNAKGNGNLMGKRRCKIACGCWMKKKRSAERCSQSVSVCV